MISKTVWFSDFVLCPTEGVSAKDRLEHSLNDGSDFLPPPLCRDTWTQIPTHMLWYMPMVYLLTIFVFPNLSYIIADTETDTFTDTTKAEGHIISVYM